MFCLLSLLVRVGVELVRSALISVGCESMDSTNCASRYLEKKKKNPRRSQQGKFEFAAYSQLCLGFPGGSVSKEFACNAGHPGLIPEWGRSPGEGNGDQLQCSCLGSPMDRGAWQASVTKSRTRLSNQTTTVCKMLPDGSVGKESACQYRRCGFDPWVGKFPWRRKWLPTPVFLPGKSHGQRSLAGYSAVGHRVGCN